MREVWKYQTPIEDRFGIEMPKNAAILCVQVQNGTPCIWVLVDPRQAEKETKQFRLAGTGHRMENHEIVKYIGSYQLSGGQLVFHLFEA